MNGEVVLVFCVVGYIYVWECGNWEDIVDGFVL